MKGERWKFKFCHSLRRVSTYQQVNSSKMPLYQNRACFHNHEGEKHSFPGMCSQHDCHSNGVARQAPGHVPCHWRPVNVAPR